MDLPKNVEHQRLSLAGLAVVCRVDSGQRSIERIVRQFLAILPCRRVANFLVSVGTTSSLATDPAALVLAALDPPANGNHAAIDALTTSYFPRFQYHLSARKPLGCAFGVFRYHSAHFAGIEHDGICTTE